MKNMFGMTEQIESNPNKNTNNLHVHEHYEIIWFLEGDAKYIVENQVFSLKPGDVIVIRRYQMHGICFNSSKPYRRFIFSVEPEFFKTCACQEYEEKFFESKNNKINSEIVQASGLQDAFLRAQKYSKNFKEECSPITRSIMIEILYLINEVTSFAEGKSLNKQLIDVMNYISQNLTQEITLDDLEKRFFISKYHLCHIFKKATGLTVFQYIIKKRLVCAKELIMEGKNIGEVASGLGFNTYSSFYRAYVNEYGVPPRQSRNISNNDNNK